MQLLGVPLRAAGLRSSVHRQANVLARLSGSLADALRKVADEGGGPGRGMRFGGLRAGGPGGEQLAAQLAREAATRAANDATAAKAAASRARAVGPAGERLLVAGEDYMLLDQANPVQVAVGVGVGRCRGCSRGRWGLGGRAGACVTPPACRHEARWPT
jgi:hypothetical protein